MLRSLQRGRLRAFTGTQFRSFHASPSRFSNAVPSITPVEKIVLDHIKAVGPMSYATYMQFCLSHPTEGYYMKTSNHIFGAQGDFITSPDISQMFGEMIAIWLYAEWQKAGSSLKMRLVELGPGRGTLMVDILRTITLLTSKLPEKEQPAIQVHLVETSQALRSVQSGKLSGTPVTVQWVESIDHIPPSNDAFTMLVAHEFFDALPIHVFRKTDDGWKEVMVSSRLTEDEKSDTGKQYSLLQHVLSPEKTAISTIFGNSSSRFQSLPVGSDLEVSPTSFRIARKVGELLAKRDTGSGGCGLIIDYGSDKAFGSSRRGFKNHQVVDIFHRPGECDLTANVDFAYLKESMQDIVPVFGPVSQNRFLSMMGLRVRLERLLDRSRDDKEARNRILEGAKRLLDPVRMGEEYSVLGITTNNTKERPAYPFDFADK